MGGRSGQGVVRNTAQEKQQGRSRSEILEQRGAISNEELPTISDRIAKVVAEDTTGNLTPKVQAWVDANITKFNDLGWTNTGVGISYAKINEDKFDKITDLYMETLKK